MNAPDSSSVSGKLLVCFYKFDELAAVAAQIGMMLSMAAWRPTGGSFGLLH
jgi:hypothetical protein